MSQKLTYSLHGNMYDLTKFITEDHPGGDEIITRTPVGGDLTEDFEAIGHQKSKLKLIAKYMTGKSDFKPATKTKDSPMLYWAPLIVLVGIVGFSYM